MTRRMSSRGRSQHVPALLALFALAGCSGQAKDDKVCPRVAVLSDAGSLTRFAPGPARNILDIDFEGEIADLATQCEFPAGKGNRRVVMQLVPVFAISRGAANSDRNASFTYFVSVVRNQDILSKQLFAVSTEFQGNRSRTVVEDGNPPISIEIPLPYRDAGFEYEVLVGFQLTPDELEYNKVSRGPGR